MTHLKKQLEMARQRGDRIVLANGCFDMLHPGHIRLLQAARQLGHVLVVAIDSDRRVRGLKGDTRPIYPSGVRAEMVKALTCVDHVLVFDNETEEMIQQINPDVLVKGGAWQTPPAGADWVTERGGKVELVPISKSYSTSNLIRYLQSLPEEKSDE